MQRLGQQQSGAPAANDCELDYHGDGGERKRWKRRGHRIPLTIATVTGLQ